MSKPEASEQDFKVKALSNTLGLLLIPAVIAFKGWAVQVMWGWFVTPAFSIPAPSVALCVGLALFASMFTGTGGRAKKEGETLLDIAIVGAVVILFCLGVGYVVHLLV